MVTLRRLPTGVSQGSVTGFARVLDREADGRPTRERTAPELIPI